MVQDICGICPINISRISRGAPEAVTITLKGSHQKLTLWSEKFIRKTFTLIYYLWEVLSTYFLEIKCFQVYKNIVMKQEFYLEIFNKIYKSMKDHHKGKETETGI